MSDLQDGAYPNIPFVEYLAWPFVNHSRLTLFKKTPLHAREAMLHPEASTSDQTFGQLAHASTLQPSEFSRLYICFDEWLKTEDGMAANAKFRAIRDLRMSRGELQKDEYDRRTTEGKQLWADFENACQGRILVSLTESSRIRSMIASVQSNATASQLIYGEGGQSELSIIWTDEETGERCKSRLDRATSIAGYAVIPDLKTSDDASESGFSRSCVTYNYASQGAMYVDGITTLGKKIPMLARDWRFLHVVVEHHAPFAVATYELDDAAIGTGRIQYREWLRRYAECKASGEWPGYPDGIMPLSLPRWAVDKGLRINEG